MHPPGLHLNIAQDMDDNVSAISNTREFYNEQDKKENEVATTEIKLFSPIKEALQAWRHHNIMLWPVTFAGHHTHSNPLLPIPLASRPTCTIHTNTLVMQYRIARANSTEFAT
jgi:hypothetical protein